MKVLFPLWSNEGEGRSTNTEAQDQATLSDMIGFHYMSKCQSSEVSPNSEIQIFECLSNFGQNQKPTLLNRFRLWDLEMESW